MNCDLQFEEPCSRVENQRPQLKETQDSKKEVFLFSCRVVHVYVYVCVLVHMCHMIMHYLLILRGKLYGFFSQKIIITVYLLGCLVKKYNYHRKVFFYVATAIANVPFCLGAQKKISIPYIHFCGKN